MKKIVKYGMVGGDLHAFIGNVHRKAIGLDGRAQLVAGAFSDKHDYNVETAEFYHVDLKRCYDDYKEMAKVEGEKKELDFVSICTPNFLHYPIAKAFLEAGINVVCEKPLCFEVAEAEELKRIAKEKNLIFVVTYAYSGYTMVKVARQMIARGDIGDILTINAEYAQEWLIDSVGGDSKTSKLSVWRKDPKISGISNAVGDIGTHIENTVHYMTGLKIKRLSAALSRFNQPLDLNANILVEYTNGVKGQYWVSQIAIGHLNGLVVRIYGTKGAIEWKQEHPDQLKVTLKGEAPRMYSRGTGYIDVPAGNYSTIPSGHPEGYHFGFGNIYKNLISLLLKKANKEKIDDSDNDFPTVEDGINGVKFIHAVIDSDKNDSQWVTLK